MKHVFPILAGALLALTLAACHSAADTPAHLAAPELKLYNVPVQQSKRIEGALGVLLAGNGNNGMGVTQPFPGTLMVLAPPNMQASIASAISTLEKASNAAAAPESLQVHFWLVTAMPGQGEDSPALNPLAAALDRLRRSLGPTHFILDAAVSAAGTMGEDGQITVKGNGLSQFSFRATPGQGGATDLWVAYSSHADADGIGDVSTTVTAAPGQYVVLAQAPAPRRISGSKVTINGKGKPKLTLFDSEGRQFDSQGRPSMRLLVVSVDRPASASH